MEYYTAFNSDGSINFDRVRNSLDPSIAAITRDIINKGITLENADDYFKFDYNGRTQKLSISEIFNIQHFTRGTVEELYNAIIYSNIEPDVLEKINDVEKMLNDSAAVFYADDEGNIILDDSTIEKHKVTWAVERPFSIDRPIDIVFPDNDDIKRNFGNVIDFLVSKDLSGNREHPLSDFKLKPKFFYNPFRDDGVCSMDELEREYETILRTVVNNTSLNKTFNTAVVEDMWGDLFWKYRDGCSADYSSSLVTVQPKLVNLTDGGIFNNERDRLLYSMLNNVPLAIQEKDQRVFKKLLCLFILVVILYEYKNFIITNFQNFGESFVECGSAIGDFTVCLISSIFDEESRTQLESRANEISSLMGDMGEALSNVFNNIFIDFKNLPPMYKVRETINVLNSIYRRELMKGRLSDKSIASDGSLVIRGDTEATFILNTSGQFASPTLSFSVKSYRRLNINNITLTLKLKPGGGGFNRYGTSISGSSEPTKSIGRFTLNGEATGNWRHFELQNIAISNSDISSGFNRLVIEISSSDNENLAFKDVILIDDSVRTSRPEDIFIHGQFISFLNHTLYDGLNIKYLERTESNIRDAIEADTTRFLRIYKFFLETASNSAAFLVNRDAINKINKFLT